MNKRVLIFFPHPLKQRHGGPYSMLFHLQQGLKNFQHGVEFLSDLIPINEQQHAVKSSPPFYKKLLKPALPKRWMDRRRISKWLKEIDETDLGLTATIDLTKYDIVHFHETIDIWRYRRLLTGFKGKVLLTSHSPKPYHLELVEDVFKTNQQAIGKRLFRQLEEIDVFAYKKADVLLFPCQEATEPYLELWPYFSEIIKRKQIGYVTTGVVPSHISIPSEVIRQQTGIPADAFVITFVGRKIAVKGYDLLIEATKIILPIYNDVYFIVVGKKDEEHEHHKR
ncbi:MAG TPA: glycosyltransferase family 4 protein, partial [Flavobacterium sp.]